MAKKTGSEAASTTARPALVATVQVAWPAATPAAVARPARRPPASVLRMVRAVSCPGVQMTSRDTPRNARYDPRPITVRSLWRCLLSDLVRLAQSGHRHNDLTVIGVRGRRAEPPLRE